MRRHSVKQRGGCGIAGVFAYNSLTAQDRPRDDDSYHNDRDAYFHGENWHGRLFERVRDDVEHVQPVTWPGGGDQFPPG